MKSPLKWMPFAVSLLVVAPLAAATSPYVGTYFGSFDPPINAGDSDNTSGAWAMIVRPDGSFAMIGFLPDNNVIFRTSSNSPMITATGEMSGASAVIPGWPLAIPPALTGSIHDGHVTGTLAYDYPNVRFSGDLDRATAGGHPPSGAESKLWRRDGSQREPIDGTAIVGPSGKIVFVAEELDLLISPTWVLWTGGGFGQIDATGSVSFASPQMLHGAMSLDASGAISGTLDPSQTGDSAVQVLGSLPRNRLTSLSTRGWVGEQDDVMIAGFAIAGSGTKRVLLRAMGPSLARFAVGGALRDPAITVMHDGAVVATADNWEDLDTNGELTDAMARTGAFPADPGSADAMLLLDLPAGTYSAIVSGPGGATGVGLAEIYAVDDATTRDARLVDVSTRARVGAGEQVLIPGLVAAGNVARTVLVRAVGPTLALTPYNVAGVLEDPILEIYRSGDSSPMASNDDWEDGNSGPTLEATAAEVGAFALPHGSRDAALLLTVEANVAYTVVVSGRNGATGVALAEVYEVGALP